MLPPFKNEPFSDFSDADVRTDFQAALDRVKSQFGQTYPLVIGDQRLSLATTFDTINPARPREVLARFADGNATHADQAIVAAAEAFKTWQHTPVEQRARYLFEAAANMRQRKHDFSATLVLEVGKSWAEADADTAEAIDFLEYYARQMLRLADSSHLLTPYDGERGVLQYIPLGVGAIIPPWNFPCAIAVA